MSRFSITLLLLLLTLLGTAASVAAQSPGTGPGEGRPALSGEILDIVADATGLTPQEILTQLREENQSLVELIENAGGDLAAVEAEISTALREAINERHSSALATLDQHVETLLNQPLPQRGERLRDFRGEQQAFRQERRGLRLLLNAAADSLDSNIRDFLAAWEEEQSLAEAISAQGGDPAAVKAAALDLAQSRLDQAVENGRITAEGAAERLSGIAADLDALLSEPRPPRAPRFG